MNLETRKLSFIQEFLRLQNEEIVSGLENFLRKRKIEMLEKYFETLKRELVK